MISKNFKMNYKNDFDVIYYSLKSKKQKLYNCTFIYFSSILI